MSQSEKKIRIFFIRHGKTPGNLLHQYVGGKTDQSLSEEGIKELSGIRDSGIYPDAEQVFVSPMIRCKETAKILFPKAEQTVVSGMKEMDFGIFEGRSAADMEDDAQYRAWVDSGCEDPIPEGEQRKDFTKRCCSAFFEVMENADPEKITVFTVHGGTIMAVLSCLGEPRKSFYEFYVKNGHGYECEWDGEQLRILREL